MTHQFFVFNGHADYKPTMKYTIGLGLTTLKNVPMGHPIAILNKGLEEKQHMLEIMRLVLSKLLMDMSINFITVKLISLFTRILARYRTFVQTMVTYGGKQFKIFRCLYEVRMSPSIFSRKCY